MDILLNTISIWQRPKISGPQADDTTISIWEVHDEGIPWTKINDKGSKAHQFFQNAILQNIDQYGSRITALKLVLPSVDGYVVRNDMIQRRFLSYELAEEAADFTHPRQHVRSFSPSSEGILHSAMRDALGAIVLKDLPVFNRPLVESTMAAVEMEAAARLAFPWIIVTPIPKKAKVACFQK